MLLGMDTPLHSPRDAMNMGLEDLQSTAVMAVDCIGLFLEYRREGKPIPEDLIQRMERIGRQHEDWIGHTFRRSCFYPKGWRSL